MREEVARLERQQANMIFRYESRATAPVGGGVAARREQYLRAVTEVRRLREEQSRLRDMIHEHALLAISFHEMSETFLEEDMVTWESALTTWVDALTMDDAVAVMRESCRIAATFEGGGPWQSTGGQFMGWRDKRKLVESTSTMIHRFTKVFPGHRAQDLMEISWNKFCDEAFYQKTIVNSSTSLQIHLLQELNDSIRVARRRTQYEGMPHKSFHTVYVMFRIQTDDGFVICLKSIDAPEVQRSLGDHESWVDVFHWITFTHLADGNGGDDGRGCEVTFGGTLHSGVRKFALHWLIESALAVVRWETACVAPHFILPGE
jgi:hypothetical protein